MRTYVFPYKMGSKSAKLLSQSLNAIRLRREGTYLPRSGDFIVNWGNSIIPAFFHRIEAIRASGGHVTILNNPNAVKLASNKLRTLVHLDNSGVPVPDFTTDRLVARSWLNRDQVYARNKLTGHSGEGIEVVEFDGDIGNAPLYTKAIENHGEYRVHVFNGEVIDYQKKRRHHQDAPNQEQSYVRNLANGWVYTRENLRHLERIEQIAIDAVNALGLDFGAVDIIKDQNGDVFVLEVNTACGMSDTTLNSYVTAIRSLINA